MKEQAYITDETFYKYLKCPSWISRELASDTPKLDPLWRTLQTEGLLQEHARELLKDREITEVTLGDMEEASQKTLELMKQGTPTITGGVLLHGHWVGRPDVLERVEGKSELGNWYYIACDIKRSSQLKEEYMFQGAFYAEILKRLTGVRPVKGYVLHANGALESYLIADVHTKFRLTLDRIEAILEGEEEEHFLTSGCKQSPWFSECESDARACDDLSLLNRIWKSEAQALRDAGFDTITKLANASLRDLKAVKDLTTDRLYFLQQQAIALADKKVIRVAPVDLPEETGVALVVDIESDPLHDLHYLFGVLVVNGATETYHSFVAKRPEEEGETWMRFVNFLRDYAGANIYHYGWYEVDVFRRMVETYGAPDVVEDMFLDNMIDLLTRLRGSVIFPSPFYSLKDIAKHLGFAWQTKDASGVDSIFWYEEWLKTGDEALLAKIIQYNEDDVRATWFVRMWAVTLAR